MALDDDTGAARSSSGFPTTHWSQLEAVRGPMTPQHKEVLNCLITRYWRPVYAYLRRRGYRHDAADLAQGFFVHSLRKELFGRADRARGRFRTYLLSCLNHFLIDLHRAEQRGAAAEGIVSIRQLARQQGPGLEPSDNETPEAVFFRAWVRELLDRVWQALEQQFTATGQQVHCELFRRRVLEPIREGGDPPAMQGLADQFGLPTKQACNYLVTARRAFQRLLREEIRVYASSEEEVASEVRDLFRFAAGQ